MDLPIIHILSSAGSDIRVGNIIMPQHVATKLKVSPQQAVKLLNMLVKDGYLTYEDEKIENNIKKIAGWRFTDKGVSVLKKLW